MAIRNILKTMGVEAHEPRVTNMLLDFMYGYVSGVLSDAAALAEQVCQSLCVRDRQTRLQEACTMARRQMACARQRIVMSCHYKRSGLLTCLFPPPPNTHTQVGRAPGEVEAEDVALSVAMKTRHAFVPRPTQETLRQLAEQVRACPCAARVWHVCDDRSE
jgi:hypothetical protein